MAILVIASKWNRPQQMLQGTLAQLVSIVFIQLAQCILGNSFSESTSLSAAAAAALWLFFLVLFILPFCLLLPVLPISLFDLAVPDLESAITEHFDCPGDFLGKWNSSHSGHRVTFTLSKTDSVVIAATGFVRTSWRESHSHPELRRCGVWWACIHPDAWGLD